MWIKPETTENNKDALMVNLPNWIIESSHLGQSRHEMDISVLTCTVNLHFAYISVIDVMHV